MTSLPYMQLYVSDYLADTAHLTAQQHGAYMLLLMNYWQRGKPLDNTNDRLSFVARMNPDEWQMNKQVLSEFFHIEGDIWYHNRIELDLSRVKTKSEQASEAGKRSAIVRSTNAERPLNHKDKDTDKDKYITSFNEFWSVYPRKVGKQDAIKAYVRALRLTTAEQITEGAKRYANDANRLPQYTAHPATWLNRGGWEDESIPNRAVEASKKPEQRMTVTPPRFSSDEVSVGIPMPEDVRDLFRKGLGRV